MSALVDIFPARSDNFGYLLHDTASGRTAAIDAPETEAITAALTRRGWRLSDIFITHHHHDHIAALAPLKAAFGARAVGPRDEAQLIAGLDETVGDGDRVELGATVLHVLATPGHSPGHIVYHDPAGKRLFSADALFSLGVGRMFAGPPEAMWAGIKRLRALPDDTMVYCGHEYSAANARFALGIEPDNETLKARAAAIETLLAAGKPTIPFLLGEDKKANPFQRADAPELARRYGLTSADPAEIFAAIRKDKDNF